MNWNHDPALAGAMGCLDCGRLLPIGEACACVTAAFDDSDDESTFHRDAGVRPPAIDWCHRT